MLASVSASASFCLVTEFKPSGYFIEESQLILQAQNRISMLLKG